MIHSRENYLNTVSKQCNAIPMGLSNRNLFGSVAKSDICNKEASIIEILCVETV